MLKLVLKFSDVTVLLIDFVTGNYCSKLPPALEFLNYFIVNTGWLSVAVGGIF